MPPVIQVNGDNPATINVGDTYADLGATITGPAADLNLGIATYLNGIPTGPLTVAIDQSGLTATSPRTVQATASAGQATTTAAATSTP